MTPTATQNNRRTRDNEATPLPPPPAPANTISLGSLQTPTPNIVDAPAPSMSNFNSFLSSYQADTTNEANAVNTNRATIRNLNSKLQAKGSRGNELDAQFGLPDLYAEQSRIRRDIADVTGSYGQAIVNEEGVARPMEFITGRQDFLQRQRDSQLLALAAVRDAVSGDILSAETRVKNALDREFGPIEAALEAEKFELTENKEALSAKDKKALDDRTAALDERSRVLEEQKSDREKIYDYAMKAAEQGVPESVIAQIIKAPSVGDAFSIASPYFYQAPEIMEVDGSLLSVDPVTGQVSVLYGQGTGGAPSDIYAQGGGSQAVLEASRQYDDTLDSTTVGNISKALTTASQIQTLDSLITNDIKNDKQFGPIIGIIRSKNPWDVSAQQFQAMLTGIVPNMARGVYGEVGVLTDTDIQNYMKTLPNLKSNAELQQLLLGASLKLVRDSVENNLKAQAFAQKDVSGFVPVLNDLDKKVGKAMLPIYQKSETYLNLVNAGADAKELNALIAEGLDIEEIATAYGEGGAPSGGGSLQSMVDSQVNPNGPQSSIPFEQAITSSAEAIAAVESGGNYQAQGPIVPTGMYAGQRALGKYQVMPGNLPQWSRGALGRVVSPEEFLASPEIQDQIFAWQFGNLAKKHGSLDDAASAWFTGQPLAKAKASGVKDVLGTNANKYVTKFRNNLNLYG